MNLKNARIIDETIGTFCCSFLSIYNLIIRIFNNNKNTHTLNNILLMKFWGMGSIILASPAIWAIRNEFPHAHITFLTFMGNREIIESVHLVDTIIEIDNKQIINFLLNLPRIFFKLRMKKFDLVIDFEFFTRFSAITSYLICKKERIGFYDILAYRGNLQTKKVIFDINQHVVDNFLNLAKAAGAETKERKLVYLHTDKATDGYIEELLKSSGVADNDKIIIINVNASRLSLQRRWPKKNFKEVIDFLSKKNAIKIILIGSPSDYGYVSSIQELIYDKEGVINIAGKITVLQLLSLLKRSMLFITNDSGPLHFAAALNIPTISFFGPETPELYGPLGDCHTVFYKNIYCSPCIHAINTKFTNCSDPKCIYKIEVDNVKNVINTFLEKL